MTRWLGRFWRWLWKDWDVRGPASVGKEQLKLAVARMNSERRHREAPTPVQRKRNWKRNWKLKKPKKEKGATVGVNGAGE